MSDNVCGYLIKRHDGRLDPCTVKKGHKSKHRGQIQRDAVAAKFRERKRPTVYLWYDTNDVVIYVGQTTSPRSRVSNHKTCSPWFGSAAYGIDWDVPEAQLDAVEAHLIHKFHPVGNKHCPLCDAVALFTGLAALDNCGV